MIFNKFYRLCFIFFYCLSGTVYAQNSDKPDLNPKLKGLIPTSPTAAALGQYGSTPVSLHTGVPSISIPLFSLSANKVPFPISLDYHASGIRIGQIASNVGMGWSLNAGGVITREVRDQPDDAHNIDTQINFAVTSAYLYAPVTTCPSGANSGTNFIPLCDVSSTYSKITVNKNNIGFMGNQSLVNTIANSNISSTADLSESNHELLFGNAKPILIFSTTTTFPTPPIGSAIPTSEMIIRENKPTVDPNVTLYNLYKFKPIPRVYDTEPDVFNFNFGSYSGQFIFADGKFKILNDQDFDIKYTINQNGNVMTGKNLSPIKNSMFNGFINSFVITTPNGYKYYFEEKEVSITDNAGQSLNGDLNSFAHISEINPLVRNTRAYTTQVLENEPNRAAVSAWHLSKIENDMGQVEYKLEYEDEIIMDHSQISQSFNAGNEKITNSSNITLNLAKRIKKINYFATDGTSATANPTGFVEFNTSASDRLDLYYPPRIVELMATNYKKSKAISEIVWKINNNSNSLIAKKFALNFDYFSKTTLTLPANPPAYLAAHRERLRLNSVQEIGDDNTTKVEPHSFTYFEQPLPPRHSPHQDYWGFYNGDKSNTLLPQVYIYKSDPLSVSNHKTMFSSFKRENTFNESGVFFPFTPYGVHDRSPDESLNTPFLKAGILGRIDYPTKGSISFEYEPNDFYWSYGSTNAQRIKKGGGLRVKKIKNSEGVEKSYEYTMTDVLGVNSTSGRIIDLPLFAKGNRLTVACGSCSDEEKLRKSLLITSSSNLNQNNIIYEKVTEKTTTAGKVIHTFNIPASYGKNTYTETSTASYTYNANIMRPKNWTVN